jgi:protoporphyrinogen oxidase
MTWISDPTRHGQPLSLIEQGRWPLVEEILTRVQTEWSEALPVYDLDLEDTLREGQAALQQLEACEIYLVGNYLGEIGLAKIMRLAADVAEKIAKKAD